MAREDNEKIIRQLYEAFNDKAIERLDELCAAGAQMTAYAFHQTMPVRDYMQNWMTAFPDGQIEPVNIVAGDEWCVVEFIGRGTQTGVLQTPEGPLPPTNQAAEIRMCEFMRVQNGKISEARSYFDASTFLEQLSEQEETETSGAWEIEQPVLH